MKNCKICNNPINAFMSFGKMPIANGFLTKDNFAKEYFFELAPAFCEKCKMFQLIKQPDPKVMFHENYAFFSQTSTSMIQHFAKMAMQFKEYYLTASKPFIVELGSNDGILLQNFAKENINHLGIEPSANVAEIARKNGVNTICAFFNKDLAEQIKSDYGKADLITASNVMCHIPDLPNIAAGIATLLKANGVLVFEDPYLGDVLQKTSYDQIYDEHVFLFSLTSITNVFAKVGLEVIDVLKLPTHGGSLRYVLAHKGNYPIHDRVNQQFAIEQLLALDNPATYMSFKQNCEQSKDNLFALLEELATKNQPVVGYAATSKSTTVINYCKLTTRHIQYISDTTPIKQGKFSPGAHIPIKPYAVFKGQYPAYAVLFAWNHAQEIFKKEKNFVQAGGKWIMFVPKVEIL